MADKSAYMGAGGYSGGATTGGGAYQKESYAQGPAQGTGGVSNPGGQVFKARTDQSCYLGP